MNNLTYLIAPMPRHGDSVLMLAYDASLNNLASEQLSVLLQSLANIDFNIANDAYLSIREAKKTGLIVQYAIAATNQDALAQLQDKLIAQQHEGDIFAFFSLLQAKLLSVLVRGANQLIAFQVV